MDKFSAVCDRVVDCHAHLDDIAQVDALLGCCRSLGLARMNLACAAVKRVVNVNPRGFVAAAMYPERFIVFGGLDHTAFWSGGSMADPTFDRQVETLIRIGARGLKMLETKPTSRVNLPIPVDDPYFEPLFEAAEAHGLPMLWHVADPEEFWDPARTPAWAAKHGWGYGASDVPKERLYGEVDRVLARHPRLRVILAHFYFLSADLPRAAAFLDAHEHVCFDLAPGVEMLHNCSADPAASREFFCRYADRICYGTDIQSSQSPAEAAARAHLVRRWLEGREAFTVPPEADFLLGAAADGQIVGMALPADVLERIYAGNFERLIGPRPSRIDTAAAEAECRRLARLVAASTGRAEVETEAGRAAEMLAAL